MSAEQQFLFYTNSNGKQSIQVFLEGETVWITQKGLSEVLDVQVPAISKHLTNIFGEGELEENSVVSKMEITASDGKFTISINDEIARERRKIEGNRKE